MRSATNRGGAWFRSGRRPKTRARRSRFYVAWLYECPVVVVRVDAEAYLLWIMKYCFDIRLPSGIGHDSVICAGEIG